MSGLPDATQRALNRTKTEVIASNNDDQEYVIPNLSGSAKLETAQIKGNLAVDETTLYVDAENNRVGIGTNTPAKPLHIFESSGGAALRIQRSGGLNILDITSSGGSVATADIIPGTTSAQVTAMSFVCVAGGAAGTGDVWMGSGIGSSIPTFIFDSSANSLLIQATGANAVAVATAILELSSTAKGFLPPRMTTTQKDAISSPATGLVVYDSTLNKLCVYTGAAWETVTSV